MLCKSTNQEMHSNLHLNSGSLAYVAYDMWHAHVVIELEWVACLTDLNSSIIYIMKYDGLFLRS